MQKIRVLFLLPGPVYNIDSTPFQSKYRYLSTFCSGYILSTSHPRQRLSFFGFQLDSCLGGSGIKSNFRYIVFCFMMFRKLKKQGQKLDLIIAYDPFKTGLIGLLGKVYFGARLIVEINGVYDSPAVWEGQKGGKMITVKRLLFPKLMHFVLKRANGVKLLFPGQIEEKTYLGRKIVSTYFDWVNTKSFISIGDEQEILLIGFPFKIKGVDVLIDAFKLIADDHPDWCLKILGWYPDNTELTAAIREHSQISHHPPVSAAEIVGHIGKCGFLVQPSRTEAMGRVLLEAMAAGKARIGTCVDGIPTVINDGVDGLLVESENVMELAEKIDLLIRDKELRNKLGMAGAERAKKEFSAEEYVRLTSEFYQRVLEQ